MTRQDTKYKMSLFSHLHTILFTFSLTPSLCVCLCFFLTLFFKKTWNAFVFPHIFRYFHWNRTWHVLLLSYKRDIVYYVSIMSISVCCTETSLLNINKKNPKDSKRKKKKTKKIKHQKQNQHKRLSIATHCKKEERKSPKSMCKTTNLTCSDYSHVS